MSAQPTGTADLVGDDEVAAAREVVRADLDYICDGLQEEFAEMAGRRLLIVGGAGFLGLYLVQAAVHWNARTDGPPIDVVVFDNYSRGVPGWLLGSRARRTWTCAPSTSPARCPTTWDTSTT